MITALRGDKEVKLISLKHLQSMFPSKKNHVLRILCQDGQTNAFPLFLSEEDRRFAARGNISADELIDRSLTLDDIYFYVS